jgi:hypothetical protein
MTPKGNLLNDLIELLGQVKSRITDGSDMLWGWYETPEQLCNDLDSYCLLLSQGDTSCLKELELLFLPTSVLQEHSIQNGWSAEYLVVSEKFDGLHRRLSCY